MSKNFFRKVFLVSCLTSLFFVGGGEIWANPCEADANSSACTDYVSSIADANDAASAAEGSAGSELTKNTFKFNPNSISPTTTEYSAGTGNIKTFLNKVANILLIVVSTGAVLSIVIGGFYMAVSGGDSEKANKGKIIITYNIIAICIALLSYAIIQFVTWII